MGGKPGFAHYDAEVPRTLAPYPQKTLVDYVANTALQWPPHPALLFKGRCVTYGELTRLSDAFAAALLAQGVAMPSNVKSWQQIFLGLHDFFVLSASEKPEPVRHDG
jgi:long-chain acyl-CoA synthetase